MFCALRPWTIGPNGPSCGPAAGPFSHRGNRPGPRIPWAATISAAGCASEAREWRSGEAYSLFLFTNEGRRLAGGINLSNVRRGVAQAASVGYWMGQPYAGQGLMTDGLRATLSFVFDDLRLHRLEAACLPNNEPSKSVLAKVGFHEEGLARQYLRINGQWADHLLFALLRADYDALLRTAR